MEKHMIKKLAVLGGWLVVYALVGSWLEVSKTMVAPAYFAAYGALMGLVLSGMVWWVSVSR
jgi:hypothetical protein